MNKFENCRFMATLTGFVLVMFALLFALPSTRPVQCADDNPQCAFLKQKIKNPRTKAERSHRQYYCEKMKELGCSEYDSVCGNGTTPPGSAGCRLEGRWAQSTPGIADTVWEIASDGKANERGGGNATGNATLNGHTLHIDWSTGTGYAGYYEWDLNENCTSGKGTLKFSKPRTDSFDSTVERK